MSRNERLHSQWVQALHARDEAVRDGDSETEIARLQNRVEVAANALVEANMGLAAGMARRYAVNGNFDDLMQDTLLGLWQALVGTQPDTKNLVTCDADGTLSLKSGWDPRRGALSTIAGPHMSGAVRRGVARMERDGITYTTFQQQPAVKKAVQDMAEEGVAFTVEEVARRAHVTVEVARQLTTASPASLSTPLGADGGFTLGDLLADNTDHVDDDVAMEQLEDQFTSALLGADNVAIADVIVFAVRHGMVGLPAMPVTDTAAALSLSRASARNSMARMDEVLSSQSGAVLPHVADAVAPCDGS